MPKPKYKQIKLSPIEQRLMYYMDTIRDAFGQQTECQYIHLNRRIRRSLEQGKDPFGRKFLSWVPKYLTIVINQYRK